MITYMEGPSSSPPVHHVRGRIYVTPPPRRWLRYHLTPLPAGRRDDKFAEVLRESIWARQTGSTPSDVAAVAQRLDTEGDPKLAEFVGLVQQAAAISS